MCLISKWRFPKRAKQDIVCYKLLEQEIETGNYFTPYINTKVDITKPFKAEGIPYSLSRFEKTSGYIHTYSLKETVKEHLPTSLYREVIFKCHIPAGTKYHVSKHGTEYCSKQIIFDRRISSYEL